MEASVKSEWQRSWHLVFLAVIGLTCAPTVLPPYTLGVFATPLAHSFGWGRGAIQAAIMFSTGLGVIGGPLAGWLVQQYGPRNAILSGLAGMTVGLLICAAIGPHIWQLYFAYGLMAVGGAGAAGVSWSYLISTRFEASRGLALGVALSGTGLCAIVMPRIASLSIELWDWRMAYLTLAAIVLLAVLPLCFFCLPRRAASLAKESAQPCDSVIGLSVSEAVHDYRFWMIGASSAGIYLAVGGLVPNLVPVLTDKGLALAEAVTVMSVFGLSIIAGRVIIGALVDHFWAPAVAAAVLLPAAWACHALTSDGTVVGYALSAAMIGAATGMELDMLGFLVARYFGLRDFARIYGRIFIFVAGSAGSAPAAYGVLYDQTRSYWWPLTVSALLLCVSACALLSLGRYPHLATALSQPGED